MQLKLAPRPTAAAIADEDLRTRLYIFADDSMMGRQHGREGNQKGTDYIARELQRLGIRPGGEQGTYFQGLPVVQRRYTDRSRLSVDGKALTWLADFVAVPPRGTAPPKLTTAEVICGGTMGDTATQITREQAAGKLVVLLPAAPGGAAPGPRGASSITSRFAGAAAVATVDLHLLSPTARAGLNDPAASGSGTRPGAAPAAPPPVLLRLTPAAAATMFGRPLDRVAPGTSGARVNAQLDFVEKLVPEYARNVIGIIPGSDPALAGQFIALGSHHDHVGFTTAPVDHDSARAFTTAEYRLKIIGDQLRNITPEERAAIRVNVDSLRWRRVLRRDSISNGADDNGSGTVAMLELAEAVVNAPSKPRRSILLVWHTGEEAGLLGSSWFVEHPTVPLDSIVAMIGMDMIGRGAAGDIPGGSEDYLAVIGSNRLSAELGRAVVELNRKQPRPLALDYRFDSETTWPGYNNLYDRSDHANYARRNIPVAVFFTGLHQDYHRVTDEPQYIDYPHLGRITRYIYDLTIELANRDKRPALSKPGS